MPGITDTTYRVGAYAPSEGSMLLKPTNRGIDMPRRAIIGIHGHGADSRTWQPGWQGGDHAQAAADRGYWVFSSDAGGPTTWGNDVGVAAITALYNYAVSLGCGTKVALMPWSMGALLALQWLKLNPTLVAGVLAWAPALNLDYYHGGSDATEINAAYTTPNYASGTYSTNAVGHDPAAEPATYRDKCPIRIYHGTADTSAPLSHSQQFVADVDDPQVELVELAGRSHTNLFAAVTVGETTSFFNGLDW